MPPPQQPTISTHVLDNERGQPAGGVRVTLARLDPEGPIVVTEAATNADGRVPDLLDGPLVPAVYQISFDAAGYFARQGGEAAQREPSHGMATTHERNVAFGHQGAPRRCRRGGRHAP